jgi:hypothetical protein
MFGTLRSPYRPTNTTFPFEPKASFVAAQTFRDVLGSNFQFVDRLPASDVNSTGNGSLAFVLRSERRGIVRPSSNNNTILAIWNTERQQQPGGSCNFSLPHQDCGHRGTTKSQCESKGCCFELPHISGPQCFFTNARFEFNATLSVATGLASRCFAGVSFLGVPLPSQELCSDSSGRLRVAATDGPIYVRLY